MDLDLKSAVVKPEQRNYTVVCSLCKQPTSSNVGVTSTWADWIVLEVRGNKVGLPERKTKLNICKSCKAGEARKILEAANILP
jgi:hypothetical protein